MALSKNLSLKGFELKAELQHGVKQTIENS